MSILNDIPDDIDIDIRYEGDGISTLWTELPDETKKYRAFVGKGHISGHGEGWGDTRDEAICAAFAQYQDFETTR